MKRINWPLVFVVCGILLAVLMLKIYAGYSVTTLNDLQKDVRDLLATDADPYTPNDTLTNLINIAATEVASFGAILKLDSVSVTSGTQRAGLNTDCMEVAAVFPDTTRASRSYDRIEFRDWGRIAAATQLTSTKYYAFQPSFVTDSSDAVPQTAGGPSLWLYPAHSGATDTLLVFYYAQANKLETAQDTTNIPYSYRPLVVYYATALAYARAHNFNEAAWWFAQYDRARQEKGLLKQLDFVVKPKVIE